MATQSYKKENGETNENVAKAVSSLRSLLSEKYENLNLPPDGNDILERCLRRRNFNLVEAAAQVDLYFKVFSELSAISNVYVLRPSTQKSYFFDSFGFVLLKQRDLKGRRVILLDYGALPVETYSLDNGIAATLLIMNELTKVSVDDQNSGVVYVVNMSAMKLGHAMQYTLARVRAMVKVLQGAIPVRVKAYHVVHSPAIFTYTYALFKHLLKSKIKDRVMFHGRDLSEFYKDFEKDTLPNCLGGKFSIEKCVDIDFMDKMCSRDAYYTEMLQYGYST